MLYTPDNITELEPYQIFVFGSNAEGNHIGGAAELAVEKFGAVMGQARGSQGQSYAIDTMSGLEPIGEQLSDLFKFTKKNKDKTFVVTKIGCGIAGYTEDQIKSLIDKDKVPWNVILPEGWGYRRLYKSLPADMSPHRYKFTVNKWHKHEGKVKVCKQGYHASVRAIDGMGYVPCEVLALVEVRGDSDLSEDDKECWQEMRLAKTHKWNKKDSVALSIFSAELVIANYEKLYPNDKRPREAIEAARKVLLNDTETNRSAARSAASAARSAASAARSAAESAAWSAASAESAAWSAESAESAAWSAESAESAARSAALDIIEAWIHNRIKF